MEKITIENLTEEIKILLQDEFVASVKEEENGLVLSFLGGQKFVLSIREG